MKYGERLKFARKARGYSQQELAKLSGVGQGSISKIERGDQEASTFDAELAMALKINPLWLSRGVGDMEYSNNPIVFPSSIPVIDADSWRSLSPTIRVFIEDFAIKANKHIVDDDTVRVLQGMIDLMTNKHIASSMHA
jgi:transcriptional regulator with XRE-family HTH domain